jgi:chemotaxis protein CheD
VSPVGSLVVVGVGQLQTAQSPDELVTYALGSCVGVAAWDPISKAGGLWHVMLPEAKTNPERALREPGAFADSGAPVFLRVLAEAGCSPRRLRLWLAGGSDSAQLGPGFEIGKRNILAVRKQLWLRGLLVDGEDCGGTQSRTVRLDLASGRVSVRHPWGNTQLGA